MLKNNLIVGMLAAFLFVGFSGIAFAGEGDYRDVVGTDEFTFSVQETSTDRAASTHIYDQEALTRADNEAGDWEHKFMPSSNHNQAVADKSNRMDPKCREC